MPRRNNENFVSEEEKQKFLCPIWDFASRGIEGEIQNKTFCSLFRTACLPARNDFSLSNNIYFRLGSREWFSIQVNAAAVFSSLSHHK